eukprot:GHVL01041000.1.p1 GENE.GHVL01041000.1~~GHVL01041000.1.p1  ORF type:complete len:241 (+),score=35.63 GHVL01041000.1:28-750(+)
MSLQGKLCLITGASRGIGKAIAISYARLGAALILVGRDAQKMISVVDECKKAGSAKVDVMEYDLSKMSEVDDLCKKLLPQGVDVIVNNAGMAARPCSVSEGDFEGVEQMFMLNLHAPVRIVRHLSPCMISKKQGTIVNIGSVAAVEGMKTSGTYAASKHGLRGFSNSAYEELRLHNIKVLLINPAFVATDMVIHRPNLVPENMIQADDVAQVACLPFTTSKGCCPQEVTLRLTLSAYKES